MNIFLREESYNLINISYSQIRGSASASNLLSISTAGVISANANDTYIIASPLVFYSNEQVSHAGQIVWGYANISLLYKRLANCTLTLGIASAPINGLSKFIPGNAGQDNSAIGQIKLAENSSDALAYPNQTEREMYPAFRIAVTTPNVPLLEVYSLECKWRTGYLVCPNK